MKEIVVMLFLITLPLLGQNNKGKISLIYNEEKFDLPITQVVIRKENNVLVSIRAERSDSSSMQSVSLEFSLLDLAKDAKIMSVDEPRISITSQRSKSPNGKRFTFNYGPKDAVVEMYYGDERMNWSSRSFQFKFNLVEISHSKEGLTINGTFSGKYNSKSEGVQPKTMAEIKEGMFKVIL